MNTNNTSKPAFPFSPSDNSTIKPQLGMSLRDYFAAKAMPLFISQDRSYTYAATQAYEIADAMLKAREA
jgi:hypothetical protein